MIIYVDLFLIGLFVIVWVNYARGFTENFLMLASVSLLFLDATLLLMGVRPK